MEQLNNINNNLNELQKELENLPQNEDQIVDIDVNVNEFDISDVQYTCVEDLTEKAILRLERAIIRPSYEYKNYIQYLKYELDLNKCDLMPGIDVKTDPISLELHHHPFTLFDITQTIAKEMILNSDGEPVSGFDIAEQVMKEHFENNVGLIPLTSTLHEMVHSNSVVVPLDYIYGNYTNFYNKYKEFMVPELVDKFEDMLISGSSPEAKKQLEEKLTKKILFLNVTYENPDDIDFDDLDDFTKK